MIGWAIVGACLIVGVGGAAVRWIQDWRFERANQRFKDDQRRYGDQWEQWLRDNEVD